VTDLEITRLCAEAMGYSPITHPNRKTTKSLMWLANGGNWNPLHDDAQAMALVKKFGMHITREVFAWHVLYEANAPGAFNPNLNRAICECVARMQEAKK
jgi:hypothetical protein